MSLRAKVEKYGRHLYDCALTKSEFPAPWDIVACTCVPRSFDSVHQQGCAQAEAFNANIDAYEARAAARVCTCGYVDFLATLPAESEVT